MYTQKFANHCEEKKARQAMACRASKKHGEWGGTRTRGHRIKSPMLYQLSYPSGYNKSASRQELARILYLTGPARVKYRLFPYYQLTASGSRGIIEILVTTGDI